MLLNPPPAGGRGGRGGGAGGGRGALPANCERPLTQWEPFCARPGEGAVVGARGGPGAAGEGGPADAGPGGPEPASVLKVFQLVGIRPPAGGGRGGGGGGRGGGGGVVVGPGDYLITMTAGGKTFRQVLHVERMNGGEVGGGFGGGEESNPTGRSHLRLR